MKLVRLLFCLFGLLVVLAAGTPAFAQQPQGAVPPKLSAVPGWCL